MRAALVVALAVAVALTVPLDAGARSPGASPSPPPSSPVGSVPLHRAVAPRAPSPAVPPAETPCSPTWDWNLRNPFCTTDCGYCSIPPPTAIYLPRESVVAPVAGAAPPAGYSGPPGPMGLADLGVGANGAYAYRTSSFDGQVDVENLSAFGPGDAAWNETPDWVSVQLDTVAARIGDSAAAPGTFWVENVARFNGSAVQFVDNVWNFSAFNVSIENSTFLSGNGSVAPSTIGPQFYLDEGPTVSVHAPFALGLYSNLTVERGHPVLYLNYSLTSGSGRIGGSYDRVVFSGAAEPWWPLDETPGFLVDGAATNPAGYADDAELVLGGDGDGANVDLESANLTLGLAAWNATDGSYRAIPSAYDHGVDSAETSEGIAATYLGSVERLRAGPSLFEGLWNSTTNADGTSVAPGWIDVHLTLPAAYAFAFGTNGSTAGFAGASWFATSSTGEASAELPPPPGGAYDFGVWANGYLANESVVVSDNATGDQSVALTAAPGELDTPVYLTSDAVAAAYGRSGVAGVAYASVGPTLWINASTDTLAPPFLQLNDAELPTFVLLAVDGVDRTSVRISGFAEPSGSLTYRYDGADVAWYSGWTQSYQFVGGSGADSVDGVSLVGNDTAYALGAAPRGSDRMDYAPMVDFLGTVGASVANVTADLGVGWSNGPWPAPGVVFDGTLNGAAVRITAANGATAVTAIDATNLSLADITTENASLGGTNASWITDGGFYGDLAYRTGAIAVLDLGSTNLRADDVAPGMGGVGVAAFSAVELNVTMLRAVAGGPATAPYSAAGFPCGFDLGGDLPCATAMEVFDSREVAIANLTESGVSAAAGLLVDDQNVTVTDATFLHGYLEGLNISGGRNVSLTDFRTSGTEGTAIVQSAWLVGGAIADGTVTDGAQAVYSLSHSQGIDLSDLAISNGSYGVEVAGINQDLTLTHWTIENGSTGLAGEFDTGVRFGPAVVTNDSMGLLYDGAEEVDATNLSVTDGSMGVDLTDGAYFHADHVSVANRSVGVDFASLTDAVASNVTVTNDSTGVFFLGVGDGFIGNVSGSDPPRALSEFVNPYFGLPFLDAAVQIELSAYLTIRNVTSDGMPWALNDWSSDLLSVSDVRGFGGGTTVALNSTLFTTLSNIFSYGARIGVELDYTINVTVVASTFEASTSYGLEVVGGLYAKVYGNNFVANDGASANGTYDPATIQAVVASTTYANFTWDGIGNYWSDWASSAPYLLGNTVEDTAPQPAFVRQWLMVEADGLPVGTPWTVTIAGTTYRATVPLVALPAWDVPYGEVAYAVGTSTGWVATPASGSVEFVGDNRTVAIAFSEPLYTLAFAATGLPAGTTWTVTVGTAQRGNTTVGSEGTIAFSLPDGTYEYTLGGLSGFSQSSVPYVGSVTVAGANVTLAIDFSPVSYAVTFAESGLPSGTTWAVDLDGTTVSGSESLLSVSVSNGTYPYTVLGVAGWHLAAPARLGAVVVNGSAVRTNLSWTEVEYAVAFGEVGLPAGSSWTVTFAGSMQGSVSSSIGFLAPNGTYRYTVAAGPVAGYAPVPATGTVTVANGSVSVTVDFDRNGTAGAAGISPATEYGIVAGVGVVAAGVALIVRRRPREPEESVQLYGEPPVGGNRPG